MKKASPKTDSKTIPLQIRIGGDTREKMKTIAERNGLSLNDVASMCLAAGLNRVSTKLDEIKEPEAAAA